jgi:hypothetical protein
MNKRFAALVFALIAFATVTFIIGSDKSKSTDMTFEEWKVEYGLMQDL